MSHFGYLRFSAPGGEENEKCLSQFRSSSKVVDSEVSTCYELKQEKYLMNPKINQYPKRIFPQNR